MSPIKRANDPQVLAAKATSPTEITIGNLENPIANSSASIEVTPK